MDIDLSTSIKPVRASVNYRKKYKKLALAQWTTGNPGGP
jgi:hypothetical protein